MNQNGLLAGSMLCALSLSASGQGLVTQQSPTYAENPVNVPSRSKDNLAQATPAERDTHSTGPIFVPAGSSALQIAEAFETKWMLASVFSCEVMSDSLRVEGINAATSCFGLERYFHFEPLTIDGKTSGDIVFNLRLTCGSIISFLELDDLSFEFLPVGPQSSSHTAANGDTLGVTASKVLIVFDDPIPAVSTVGLAVMAGLLALVGAFVLSRR